MPVYVIMLPIGSQKGRA